MKKILLLAFVLSSLAFATPTAAQTVTAEDSVMVQTMLNSFTQNLDLDETQQAQVEGILLETAGNLAGIRHLKSENIQAFRQQRKPIFQQMRGDMQSVLSADQFATFEAAMAQRRQKGGKKGKGQGRGNNRPSPAASSTGSNGQNLGADALARSLDFLFEEILTPTVRNKVNQGKP